MLISYLKEADALLASTSSTKPKLSSEFKLKDGGKQIIPSSTYLPNKEGPESPKLEPSGGDVIASNVKIAKRTNTTASNDSTDSTDSIDRYKTIKPDIGMNGNLSPLRNDLLNLEIESSEPGSPPNEKSDPAPLSPDLSSPRNVANQQMWVPQPPLRNHYDAVRAVCFHPRDLSLFTGSEDHTISLWRVSPTLSANDQYEYFKLEMIYL